jgi:hypothetical protein
MSRRHSPAARQLRTDVTDGDADDESKGRSLPEPVKSQILRAVSDVERRSP